MIIVNYVSNNKEATIDEKWKWITIEKKTVIEKQKESIDTKDKL